MVIELVMRCLSSSCRLALRYLLQALEGGQKGGGGGQQYTDSLGSKLKNSESLYEVSIVA